MFNYAKYVCSAIISCLEIWVSDIFVFLRVGINDKVFSLLLPTKKCFFFLSLTDFSSLVKLCCFSHKRHVFWFSLLALAWNFRRGLSLLRFFFHSKLNNSLSKRKGFFFRAKGACFHVINQHPSLEFFFFFGVFGFRTIW